MGQVHQESFDNGPGGWVRVVDNVQPLAALPVREGAIWSWGPWWVDCKHAPPGAGRDYPLWPSSIAQAYVAGDAIRVNFAQS